MEIRTYKKLEVFVDRWIAGTIDLLILESAPGLGKTFLVKKKLDELEKQGQNSLSISAHVTPLAFYKSLYSNINQLVFLDDITSLFINKLNVSLLMQLCDSTKIKKMCYRSTTELLEKVPQEFLTTSKTLVACNFVEGSNQYLAALRDRAIVLRFNPTKEEILNKIKEVSKSYDLTVLEESEKQEVLDLIIANIHNIKNLSLRTIMRGFSLLHYSKLNPKVDWKADFLGLMEISDKLKILNELMLRYDNDKERLEHFPFSKPTFYHYKKMLS